MTSSQRSPLSSVEVAVDREKVKALSPAGIELALWTRAPTWNSEGGSSLLSLLPAIQTLTYHIISTLSLWFGFLSTCAARGSCPLSETRAQIRGLSLEPDNNNDDNVGDDASDYDAADIDDDHR